MTCGRAFFAQEEIQDMSLAINSLEAIIIAIVAIITAHLAQRACARTKQLDLEASRLASEANRLASEANRLASEANRLASDASRLASLAIDNVASSRASRLAAATIPADSFFECNQESTSPLKGDPGSPCLPDAISSTTASGPLTAKSSSSDFFINPHAKDDSFVH